MHPLNTIARTDNRLEPLLSLRLVTLVLGIWILLGTFLGIQNYLNASAGGSPLTLAVALNRSIRRYLLYAVLTFPCLWLCRRYSFTSRRWLVPLLAHLVGVGSFMVLCTGLRQGIGPVVVNAETGASPVIPFEFTIEGPPVQLYPK
jgi:hypothetical protein